MRYISRHNIFADILHIYADILAWCHGWKDTSPAVVWTQHCGPYKGEAFPHAMSYESFVQEEDTLRLLRETPNAACLTQAYGLLGCRIDALPADELQCCECGRKDVDALIEFGSATERGATCLDSVTVPPPRLCLSCLAEATRLAHEKGAV